LARVEVSGVAADDDGNVVCVTLRAEDLDLGEAATADGYCVVAGAEGQCAHCGEVKRTQVNRSEDRKCTESKDEGKPRRHRSRRQGSGEGAQGEGK
jgi:hypothetical protein